jgi:hypothetical protein
MNQQFFCMKAHDLGGAHRNKIKMPSSTLYEGRDRRAETSSGSDRSNEEETATRHRMINGRKARLPLRQFGIADEHIGRIFHGIVLSAAKMPGLYGGLRTGLFATCLLRFAQPYARTSTVFVDEFDAGGF